MRKRILLIIIGFFPLIIFAQINLGDLPKPVPSESSLSTFYNAPISKATGVPDISLPLFNLSSYDEKVSANLLLQYHPNTSATEDELVSEVGLGWSFIKGGVISREINGEVDEDKDNQASYQYYKNTFDDIYYYNLPTGISGKFRFIRDKNANTFEVVNMSPNKVKIEYTRSSNTATLIVNSFTITDSFGYKYYFNDYSESRAEKYIGNGLGYKYKSAFYITKITTANNVDLLLYEYQKENLPMNAVSKLNKITSPGLGSISIEYDNDSSLRNTPTDPYSVKKIILKRVDGAVVSQYQFVYSLEPMYYKKYEQLFTRRLLSQVNKLDKNGVQVSSTKMEFDEANLKLKLTNQGGGVVTHLFGENNQYEDHNSPAYLQLLAAGLGSPNDQQYVEFNSIDFNTHNTTQYTLTVTGASNVEKTFKFTYSGSSFPPPIPTEGGDPIELVDYKIMNVTTSSGAQINTDGSSSSENLYKLVPGTYTVKIIGNGLGTIFIKELITNPPPYNNYGPATGFSVGSSTYYDKENGTPVKKISYSHDILENGILSSSGNGTIYGNVKETDSSKNGYTHYFYTETKGLPPQTITYESTTKELKPVAEITKQGLLSKKEVYDNAGKLLSSVEYDYTFEILNNYSPMVLWDLDYIPAFVTKSKATTKHYEKNGKFSVSTSENTVNPLNLGIAYSKDVSSDGSISEKIYEYATDNVGTPQLLAANIISVPIRTTIKNNGKIISQEEIKFEGSNSLYPSSVVTRGINGSNEKTSMRFDSYNSNGNPIQYTVNPGSSSSSGYPVTLIWGYNQSKLIAKIEGATYAQVSGYITDILAASDKDNAPLNYAMAAATTESQLISKLDEFRRNPNLSAFNITTYTFDPLIGTTSTTLPSGIRETYHYDAAGRLEKVFDAEGKTVKEYKYNYKQ